MTLGAQWGRRARGPSIQHRVQKNYLFLFWSSHPHLCQLTSGPETPSFFLSRENTFRLGQVGERICSVVQGKGGGRGAGTSHPAYPYPLRSAPPPTILFPVFPGTDLLRISQQVGGSQLHIWHRLFLGSSKSGPTHSSTFWFPKFDCCGPRSRFPSSFGFSLPRSHLNLFTIMCEGFQEGEMVNVCAQPDLLT